MMHAVRRPGQHRNYRLTWTVFVEYPEFAPDDVHIVRRLDAKRHPATRHSADYHGDTVTDNDLFTHFSSENQHRGSSLLDYLQIRKIHSNRFTTRLFSNWGAVDSFARDHVPMPHVIANG